jgi:hypothetical protein
MDSVAITVGASWTLIGLVIITLAIPLTQGRIPRNGLYGIRFPQSFQSDDAWFAINRFGAKRMMIWSIPIIFVGIISLFLPLRSHTALTLTLGYTPLIFILIPVLESWRFARNYPPKT